MVRGLPDSLWLRLHIGDAGVDRQQYSDVVERKSGWHCCSVVVVVQAEVGAVVVTLPVRDKLQWRDAIASR